MPSAVCLSSVMRQPLSPYSCRASICLSIHRPVFAASQLRSVTLWMLFFYPLAGPQPGLLALRRGRGAQSRGAVRGAARSALALDGVTRPWPLSSTSDHPKARRTTFTDAAFSAGTTSFDIKPLVQAWANGTPNYGLLLKKDPASSTSVATFKTRESSSSPELSICYVTGDACAGVVCKALDECHVAGTCNPATGQCSNPIAPNGTACTDANKCTQTVHCQAGACTGSNPVTCTASDQCHVAGTCDSGTGQCSNPAAPQGTACSDSNAAT